MVARGDRKGANSTLSAMDQEIIRSLQGRATEDEEKRLREWRRTSSDNERRYREVVELWELTETARASAGGSSPPSAIEIIERAEQRQKKDAKTVSALIESDRTGHRFSAARIWVGLAAAALVAFGLGLGQLLSDGDTELPLAATEIVTGPLEKVTVRLNDGSVVRLAPESRLQVTDGSGEREVWVDGRAYFSVAEKDEAFRVNTRAGTAQVLGTRFAVHVEADTMRVSVEEGRVALGSGRSRVDVIEGQTSVATGGLHPSVSEPVETPLDLSWMGQFLAFQSTPLVKVAQEIEQRYDVQVRVLDDALAQRTVTASFTNQSVDEVLTTVCRIIAAHCTRFNGVATIEP